jgi:hypothetical protein
MSNAESNSPEEFPSYGLELFKLVHRKIGINDLLNSLNVTVNDNLGTVSKGIIDLLDEGAEIAGKYIFLTIEAYLQACECYQPFGQVLLFVQE